MERFVRLSGAKNMRVTSLANATPELRVADQSSQVIASYNLAAFRGILLAGGASALLWLALWGLVSALR
jgi:hypothetical protein